MGCASSTPMITTGSEMLKAATHVATDAKKGAEEAVQDVTHTLEKTIDTTKETVGTAVTGMAHELGNAIKEKTDAIDEAASSLMHKLHLKDDTDHNTNISNGNKNNKIETAKETNDDSHMMATKMPVTLSAVESLDIEERLSRAPTPAAFDLQDTDSLSTATPEPEIEQALAMHNEDNPPTPKPTLAELEQLSAEIKQNMTTTATTAATTVAAAAIAALKDGADDTSEMVRAEVTHILDNGKEKEESTLDSHVERTGGDEEVIIRPSTTEWEKYADLLARLRKGGFGRGRGVAGAAAGSVASRLRNFGPERTNSQSLLVEIAAGAKGLAGVPLNTTIAARPMAIVHHLREDRSGSGDDRDDSSPLHSNLSSARGTRSRFSRTRGYARQIHREFASMVGYDKTPLLRAPGNGRKFDFNPSRLRVSSPTGRKGRSPTNRKGRSPTNLKGRSPTNLKGRSPTNLKGRSPIRAFPQSPKILSLSLLSSPEQPRIKAQTRSYASSPLPPHHSRLSSSTATPEHVKLRSKSTASMRVRPMPMPIPVIPAKTPTLSRSSTNNSITTKTRKVLPNINQTDSRNGALSRSSSSNHKEKHALSRIGTHTLQHTEKENIEVATTSGVHKRLFSTSPININHTNTSAHEWSNYDRGRRRSVGRAADIGRSGYSTPYHVSPVSRSSSGVILKNSSSFLTSPRTSPFGLSKSYTDFFSDKENKIAFIADLSSVTERRTSVTPVSPYKIRDRCAVCYNKYVIK